MKKTKNEGLIVPRTQTTNNYPDLPEDVQALLGLQQGIELDYKGETKTFSLKIIDLSQRYMTRFLRDYHACFKTKLVWDKETKSHIIPISELEGLKQAVVIARDWASEIINTRETWLEDTKSDLLRDLKKPFTERFEKDLAEAKEWRKLNPQLAKNLPPLPRKYTPPVVLDRYAKGVPGYYSNGEIRGYNRYYVAQFTGGGKLMGQQGCVDREPIYLTLHNTDRFFHSRDDWNNMEAVLAQRLGEWLTKLDGTPTLKCIEYLPPNAKAIIEDYQPERHSTRARMAFAEQQQRSTRQPEQHRTEIVRRPSHSMNM